MRKYLYTNQKDLRKAFRAMIIELCGYERWLNMTDTDKRCEFNDWTDSLCKDGRISLALYNRAYWK